MTDKVIEAACSAYVEHERYGLEEAMSAAIAAYEQAMWRPIKEAPKDGSLFVVWCPSYVGLPSMFSLCAWRQDAGFCVDELREPTHYRPLPLPPSNKE